MSRIDVLMPQMGESIAEGTVSKWLKQLGDPVKRDEPLFEISTDKVDAEIPSPSAGVLAEIKVQQGQTVPVQTLVAVIETEAGAAGAPSAAAQRAPAASGAPAAPASAATAKPAPPPPAPPSARPPDRPSAPVGKGDGVETAEDRLRTKSTPLVRKIAAEHQVDIATIPGTGIAGRVTKQDILGFIESGAARTAARAPAAPVSRPSSPVPGLPPVAHPPVEPWPGDRVEPFSKIRKITADHMIMSRRVSAHVTSFFEVDYIIYRADVNIGIAVALDWGLIVPVVKHADELSLLGLARAINDLGERARTKKLSPDEVQKGTFTITNPGVFGSVIGTPIINQPQAAILCVGSIEKQPAVITMDGTDSLAIRIKGMLSLAFDHRIVDGADADRFMADVKTSLQQFPESAV